MLGKKAGQEHFKSITRNYYRHSAVALVVFDITKAESFKNAGKWIEECAAEVDNSTVLVLIGNKCDLEEERQVSTEEAKKLAESKNMLFFETSAKTGVNIDTVFLESTKMVDQKLREGKIDPANRVWS